MTEELPLKLIFVAGPYRADTEYGVHQNIARAEAAAIELWKLGLSVICPHKNTAYFGGATDDQVWLAGDLEQLRRCDALFLVKGYEQSEGALGEIKLAKELDLPIFEDLDEVAQWLIT